MSTLVELEQRIAALEADTGGGADQLNPNVLTVNPDGTIGADFSGHVHAKGLDLDAGVTSTPPDVDRIRWIRQTDGAVIAALAAFSTGPPTANALSIGASQPNPDPADGTRGAYLSVDASIPALKVLLITTSSQLDTATILGSGRQSSFMQLPQPDNIQAQVGITTVALAVGWQTVLVALPIGWANHVAFLAGVNPANGSSILSTEMGATGFGADNSHGFININSTIAQAAVITWISFGN